LTYRASTIFPDIFLLYQERSGDTFLNASHPLNLSLHAAANYVAAKSFSDSHCCAIFDQLQT
jgi:hypothetical protein